MQLQWPFDLLTLWSIFLRWPCLGKFCLIEDRCVTTAQGPLLWQQWWLFFSSPGTVLSPLKSKTHYIMYLIATATFGPIKENNRKFIPTLFFKKMPSMCSGCSGIHSLRSMHWGPDIIRNSVGPEDTNVKGKPKDSEGVNDRHVNPKSPSSIQTQMKTHWVSKKERWGARSQSTSRMCRSTVLHNFTTPWLPSFMASLWIWKAKTFWPKR